MQLTIFLDIMEANSCAETIMPNHRRNKRLSVPFKTRDYWGAIDKDVIVECDDKAARELARHAHSRCPSAVQKIRRLFRLARLRRGESRDR